MLGTEASRLEARHSAERASCPIRSREACASGNRETAATTVGLEGSETVEEPRVSAGVAVVMDIPEGPVAGVGRGAYAGDGSVFTNSTDAAFFLSA